MSDWTASMISPERELATAPRLRRTYRLLDGHGEVVAGDLRASALGVLDLRINGIPVGDDVLTPGWSAYEWRTRFAKYDVRGLQEPESVLTAELGNGWYRGRGDTLEIDPVLPPSLDGLTATVPLDGLELNLTYRLGPHGRGPTTVTLNGTLLHTIPLTNPYRRPGVSVDLAEVLTALGDGLATLLVETC